MTDTNHAPDAESVEVDALTFFNDDDAQTVAALAERIIPGDDENPGATRAGVVYYIDRAVAGFSTDLQPVYRKGLRDLELWCRDTYDSSFRDLPAATQDDVVRSLLGPEVAPQVDGLQTSSSDQPDDTPLRRMIAVVREHTIEGFFCDPVYGGNRDTVGWRLVGFPGAQWGYTATQMEPGFDGRSIPVMTLADLRRRLPDLPPNDTYTFPHGNSAHGKSAHGNTAPGQEA